MTVEFISVGTEILLGNIVNTNAAYLSEKCAGLGLSCYHQSVVGDNEKRLEDALRLALSRSDIVILGGGLGPTKDDLTKEVTAKVFGKGKPYVIEGIESGRLPIGTVAREKVKGNVYISPKLLWEYTGYVWKGEKACEM